jgi:hypothetical protein
MSNKGGMKMFDNLYLRIKLQGLGWIIQKVRLSLESEEKKLLRKIEHWEKIKKE